MKFEILIRKTALISAVLVIALFVLTEGSLAAPVETVTNVNDMGAGSLREAIANVDPGGTVNFNIPGVGPHTIVLASEIVIDESMTIDGPGADTVTISGNDSVRIFNIDDGDETPNKVVSISGLRFINGFADVDGPDGGGAIKNGEELSIDSCVFEDNNSTLGGAIFNDFAIIEEITHTDFNRNTAASTDDVPAAGGAILNNGALYYLTHCTFTDNKATGTGVESNGLGGAIANAIAIFQIYKSTFNGNTATSTNGIAAGGAIFNTVIIQAIEEVEFSGNSTSFSNDISGGGAISNIGQIDLIRKSTFSGNMSEGQGGAIFNDSDSLIDEITHTDFSGNMATSDSGAGGGAVYNSGEINEIAECAFSGNEAATETETGPGGTAVGGAIVNDGELIKIARTIFNGNIASTTSDSTSTGTFASGGAIHNVDTLNFIENSTFSGNTAVATAGFAIGGAITNFENDLNISFTTITNNTTAADDPIEAGAGGIFDDEDKVSIRNSIVAFNTGGNCISDIATNPEETNNYSDNDDCGFDFDNADIQLGPLADNGGPTRTVALIDGDPVDGASPDCDTLNNPGVPVTEDQRGFVRPFPEGGLCDAGAFELGFVKVTIKKVSIPSGGTGFPFSGSQSFEDSAEGCEITQDFILDDQDSASCIVPVGDYTITEHLGAGEVVSIFCEQLPEDSSIDSLNGTLSFSIAHGDAGMDCVFVNSFANTVVRVGDEAPGDNCEFGGTKIESGFDSNQNGVLDDEEVIPEDTKYICNEEAGQDGTDGDDGQDGMDGEDGQDGLNSLIDLNPEPPGPNCLNGGVRVDSGPDSNRNGVLDPGEITDTSYICNPSAEDDSTADPNLNSNGGSGNKGCSGSSLAGPGKMSDLSDLLGLIVLPLILILGRRLSRKK